MKTKKEKVVLTDRQRILHERRMAAWTDKVKAVAQAHEATEAKLARLMAGVFGILFCIATIAVMILY